MANQPVVKGGVLFVDSADKAARFIWLCDAFNIPLVYLADVPGFMIGSEVERQGIIRHGAKMITAVSEATVPTCLVIVRKAYGAGSTRWRARLRTRRVPRPADGEDRGDGAGGGGQRRLLQQDRRRSPTRPSASQYVAPRAEYEDGHRHPAARRRSGHRRDRRAGASCATTSSPAWPPRRKDRHFSERPPVPPV